MSCCTQPPGHRPIGPAAAGVSVLVVVGDLDIGGAETHLASILPRLSRERYRVTVYTLTHKGALAPRLEAAGISVVAPPGSRLFWRRLGRLGRRTPLLAVSISRLLLLMVRERPAVVHMFLPAAYIAGGLCAVLTRCPVRIMSRRSLNLYQRSHRLARRVEGWLHRRMRAILGHSAAVVAELRAEGAAPDRLGLLYNGVDPAPFAAESRAARAALGIADDALVLVIVANLIPYKGHADLIAALSHARAGLPDGWVLLCVGRDDGPGAALKARAEALGIAGSIRWLGERNDVPALLAAADIGLLCSHQEGFSNSILEGMAAGLAMVVTDVGGNPEAVVDGVTGLVVPPRDPRAFGEALLALASDPERRAAMGEAGRRRVTEDFSLDACVARYARLYDGLAAGDTRPVAEIIAGRGAADATQSG